MAALIFIVEARYVHADNKIDQYGISRKRVDPSESVSSTLSRSSSLDSVDDKRKKSSNLFCGEASMAAVRRYQHK
jgi:hypothetical protein